MITNFIILRDRPQEGSRIDHRATRCISRFFYHYCPFPPSKLDLTSKDSCWDSFLFVSYFLIILWFYKAQRLPNIFLFVASWCLIQEADITDGRAGHPHSWVLHSCCRSKSCSKNRAPRSMGCSLRNTHTPMLGDDNSITPINSSLTMTSVIRSIFIQGSWLVHFPAHFSLILYDFILIDARVRIQCLIGG